MSDAVKVFVSYSHDTQEHADRVRGLTNQLRADGIDVVLDQYHPTPDEGWPLWMERNLDAAGFVLLVCTETYRRRVMHEEESGVGLGVQWEGTLIYNRIYRDSAQGSRYIPILFEDSDPAHIPTPVQGHPRYQIYHSDLSDPGYKRLYRHLTGQWPPEPELGPRKVLEPSLQGFLGGTGGSASAEGLGPCSTGSQPSPNGSGQGPASSTQRLHAGALFLSPEDHLALKSILSESRYLTGADASGRSRLLGLFGLERYVARLDMAATEDEFVDELFTQLSALSGCPPGYAGQPALSVFLRSLAKHDRTLDPGYVEFLEFAAAQCEEWYAKNLVRLRIRQALAGRREHRAPGLRTDHRIRVDRNMIVSYDLHREMGQFSERLRSEGVFSFSVGGDSLVLEEYILERMQRELRRITGRSLARKAVWVYRDDLAGQVCPIEAKFAKDHGYERVSDWPQGEPDRDMLLVVWNYNVPLKHMSVVAKEFWERSIPSILPHVAGKSRCFVVIWANSGRGPLDQFPVVRVPDRFEMDDLTAWFQGQLLQMELDKGTIEHYLDRLRLRQRPLVSTYREMKDIVSDLQGGAELHESASYSN